MKDNLVEVVFILDRSGSMNGLEGDTIGGYNKFLQDQKLVPGDANISTVLFDNVIEVIHDRVDIKAVKPITDKEYYVRGSTALFDAIGQTINHIGKCLSETDEDKRPSKVMFVIITDGMENSSREFSHPMIKSMIEHQKTKYSWDFFFLGANFDAENFSESISIHKDRSIQYENDSEGIQTLYGSMSEVIEKSRMVKEVKPDDNWKKRVKKGK